MARTGNPLTALLGQKGVRYLIGGVLLLLLGTTLFSRMSNGRFSGDKQLGSTLGLSKQESEEVLLTTEVNQSIEIPIGTGDESLTYTITNAELKDSIVLRGQNARAIDGKQFLILNLKLSNKSEQRIKLDSRDYVRLGVNGGDDRLPPTIHNDPIEIQPISDQFSRLGFSVYTTDKDFVLYLGEISEEKIEIPLAF